MTDRVKGYIVTLAEDTRTDDAEAIEQALRMVKGVIDVSPSIVNIDDHLNRKRVRYELAKKLWEALEPGGE